MHPSECSACSRVLDELAYEREDVLVFSLDHLKDPGKRPVETEGQLCGECGDELVDLTAGMESISPADSLRLSADEGWWEYTTCGFCGDDLGHRRGVLGHAWEGSGQGTQTILCQNCVEVTATFIAGLPDQEREGERFIGRFTDDDVRVSVDEADFDTIYERFSAIDEGDAVSLEVHKPGSDEYPDRYFEGSGVVFNQNTTATSQGALYIDAEEGPYEEIRVVERLYKNRSLDVIGYDETGEQNRLGKATVLNVEE